jgi:diaminopimelate decarboxylase
MEKDAGSLLPIVKEILSDKDKYLNLTSKHKTPFYVYDQEGIDKSTKHLVEAFNKYIPKCQIYYAMKINHCSLIVNRVIEMKLGLDVASKRELLMAINTGAKKIVYFSPGKSNDDLKCAIEHKDIVRIHIDSFEELHKLGKITSEVRMHIEVGVRIHMPPHGLWQKYGIPLKMLKVFWKEADKYSFIKLNGVHLHRSRNRTVDFYVNSIHDLSQYIKSNFSVEERKCIKYIDLGGGFEPYCSEGFFIPKQSQKLRKYKILIPPTIEEYAQSIGSAIKKYLDPIVEAVYLLEPGRYICNNAMHIVLNIADVKDKKNYILNGGVNMVGWQRFENEYFPLINITHPSEKERACNMWGNLCTTWDIWGYYCYTSELMETDIIIVPNQGALTYSLAQSFINDIPPVYTL